PTPEVTTYTATGTYTIPAHTVTITNTLTTVIPVVTTLTMGPNTYGGVTTVVESATTVTCPYATVETTGDVTTSKIISTTYVCPSAGTYTVGATTSTVTETDVVPCTYAAPAVYTPGTYTQTEAVVTITKTSQVVVCPYETGSPSIPAPTYAAPPKETSTTEESAPAYTPKAVKPSTSAPAYEAPATTSAPVVNNVPTAGGDLWSIAYSPFKVGGCLDKSTIEADIADIASKGFKNIRVYSPECGTLSSVADACAANGIKMIVGIQIDARGDSFYEDQVSQYEKWAKWELVETVVVGNECMFNGFCTVDDLVSKIKDVRTRFSGYTGPVTTADTVGNFETATKGNSALCDAIDIIGVNIQVYFDGGRTAEMAGEFLKTQMAQASACCPDKETYVFEAGWPTVGQSQGVAVASKTNQATALKGFMAAAPGKISYFTYRDDEWKPPGNLGIEQHYGCGDFF
ncbi:glycoside hydrolase superfamily, partial [Geopyxis carbonaria]